MKRSLFAWALIVVATAAYAAQDSAPRKRMLFDQAHHNLFATLSGNYSRFAGLAREDGFSITENKTSFDTARLDLADVLVIVNPSGAEQKASTEEQASPAFRDPEVNAVYDWVSNGGALLLVTDHFPTGAAAQNLAARFGVKLSAAWTDDPAQRRSLPGYGPTFGQLLFTRGQGGIGDHPITQGINSVATIGGESLSGPTNSVSLLRLSRDAVDAHPTPPAERMPPASVRDFSPCPGCRTTSAAGRSQGLAFEFGRGRVVVLAEMGTLVDFSIAGTDNRRFALNLLRWLSREV